MTITYTDLIRETFINPLRSVTIIDDQYPTWEDWLQGYAFKDKTDQTLNSIQNKSWENPDKIKSRIDELRNQKLIIDIHDGNEEESRINYYHHSDLVILDYQLEGQNGDGKKSIEIAQKLLTENSHFNLIVLHTQEDNDRLLTPFSNILLKLMGKPEKLNSKLIDQGDELIDEFEIQNRLNSAFTLQHYLTIRIHDFKYFKNGLLDKTLQARYPIFSELTSIVHEYKMNHQQVAMLLTSICNKIAHNSEENFSDENAPGLKWSSSEILWIKTDKGFIAFTSKKSDKLFIDVLLTALTDWQPTPSRMISGKIRNLLHVQGAEFEDKFLHQDHIGWLFYKTFNSDKSKNKISLVTSELNRQMERYSDLIHSGIQDFANKILLTDSKEDNGQPSKFEKMYQFEAENIMIARDNYNSFVSCKPHASEHLTPGNILCHGDNIWIVVTPSCDLVPNQKISNTTPNFIKFTAAKLHKRKIADVREEANTGNIIFLKNSINNDEISCYSIYGAPEAGFNERYLTQKIFLAQNRGEFTKAEQKYTVTAFSEKENPIDNRLEFEEITFTLHHQQLRYEYALNLLSKIGIHASRIGLDYISK
ncbi:response regulator receiver domain [Erwinia sp.]|uniref:response regulator receiver domain n=1 Tax=Erwinia citreus TaxID=558 RepID=UPI003C750C35